MNSRYLRLFAEVSVTAASHQGGVTRVAPYLWQAGKRGDFHRPGWVRRPLGRREVRGSPLSCRESQQSVAVWRNARRKALSFHPRKERVTLANPQHAFN